MTIAPVIDDKWKVVKPLLMEVLAIDPPERLAYLRKRTESREIIADVETLLAFEDDASEILNTSAIELSRDFFDDTPEPPCTIAGQEIGAYRIVSEIGMGGMGAVYLAERSDGKFDQRVAIKLLKREFNTARLRESFKREIEIQAKLVHPNVATMLDTGTTDDGIPYIVMEFIDGVAIDKYCHANQLALTERLKIFNKACEAVAHAHKNLIVHRDLKPSNIIVTADGVPKLLDFGISKLIDKVEDSGMTNIGAMTPEYASPEQVRGETVTTATDVYSLGVILFKLLTGGYPYHVKSKPNGEVLREITDSQPIAPSSVASASIKDRERRSHAVLPSQLSGDIDNIILKALRKEPDERYQAVEQFSDDIWRFIDGMTITARPATRSYRLSKFYARNKIAVLAGILIFISLVAGITTSMWQANSARAQAFIANDARNAAVLETDRAKAEQLKSEKISKFMAKLISYGNAAWYGEGYKYGGQARVIDALLDMSDKIDTEFANEPDVAAELHHKFGEAIGWAYPGGQDKEFVDLLSKKQAAHFLRALELRVQYYGEWHELVAKDLFYTYTLIGKNEFEKAVLLDRALNMMRDTNPSNLNLPYIVEAYAARLLQPAESGISEPYLKAVTPATNETRFQVSERMLRESLPIFRLHYKVDNRPIFAAECDLAYALAMQEKWSDFDEHYAICKQSQIKLQDADSLKVLKRRLDVVEKARIEMGSPR